MPGGNVGQRFDPDTEQAQREVDEDQAVGGGSLQASHAKQAQRRGSNR
jgi:hypothetical protein